jgi:prophage regulatory protein
MADQRIPRLMGQQEIRERLGYSRQHTAVLINAKGFPDPVVELAMGRIWLAADVEAWIAANRPELAEGPEGER